MIILQTAALAAGLQLGVTNITELFNLQSDSQNAPNLTNMNDRGEFLHTTSFFPPEGGTGQATEAYVEHRDGTRTRFAVPYTNGIFAELRLNNRGEIAAVVIPDIRNFDSNAIEVWVYSSSGVATRIGNPTGRGAENLGFNDHGQVSISNFDEDHAYRYTPGIGWENLGSLANDGFAKPSWGNSINSEGAVTGATSVGASNTITPFLARQGAAMEDIPAPFGTGRAINDNFVVTGDGGWVWHANEMRMQYIFSNQAFSFIRPSDINNAGAIIGVIEGSASFDQSAFLWDEADEARSLDILLEDPLSWTVTEAYAINDDGWILAAGYEGRGVNVPDRKYAFLLLRPVPEPGSAGLVTLACAFLLRRRR